MAAGIGLVLASQFVAAGQLLYDRLISNGRMSLSPLKVVGCEGLLGVILMVRPPCNWLSMSQQERAAVGSFSLFQTSKFST